MGGPSLPDGLDVLGTGALAGSETEARVCEEGCREAACASGALWRPVLQEHGLLPSQNNVHSALETRSLAHPGVLTAPDSLDGVSSLQRGSKQGTGHRGLLGSLRNGPVLTLAFWPPLGSGS